MKNNACSSLIQTILSVLEFHQINHLHGSRTVPPVGNSRHLSVPVTLPRRIFFYMSVIITHESADFNRVCKFFCFFSSHSPVRLIRSVPFFHGMQIHSFGYVLRECPGAPAVPHTVFFQSASVPPRQYLPAFPRHPDHRP